MTRRSKPDTQHYIASIGKLELRDQSYTPEKIVDVLLDHGTWQLGDKANNLRQLQPGDRIVFYASGPKRMYFLGTAQVASPPRVIGDADRGLFDGEDLPFMSFAFDLKNVKRWRRAVPAADLLDRLEFVEPRLRNYWGLYFRQSLRRISRKDYDTITRGRR